MSELAAAQAHVRQVVTGSRTSFLSGMRILSKPRREAMFAIYAFCREVDDIADEPDSLENKRAGLEAWRRAIDRLYDADQPSGPITLALRQPIHAYDLPRAEFHAVIDGMAMDAEPPGPAPDWETLRLYCRRVAGAVGVLSIHAFGATDPAAWRLAETLGEALQLTNILRDIDEDAARGRIYLPAEALMAAGLPVDDAAALLQDARLDAACRAVVAVARADYAAVDRLLGQTDRRALRPALLMMGVYERTLDRLEARGWVPPRSGGRLGKWQKLHAALVQGLLRSPR